MTYPADEFKEFQAGGVEQIVLWHGLDDNVQNRAKELAFDHVADVELVLQTNTCAEEFESH